MRRFLTPLTTPIRRNPHVPVRATIESIGGLSAHGEQDAVSAFKKTLDARFKCEVYLPREGESVEIS